MPNQPLQPLKKGRPVNAQTRLKKEQKVYDYLDALNISYCHVDHPPAMSVADCEAVDQILGVPCCKNLFLCNTQQTDFYLLLLPYNKKYKASQLSKQIGTSRLSFANADHMQKYLNITPGAVSIMGLINDTEKQVHLLIDKDTFPTEYATCHPCVNTTSIRLLKSDLFTKFLPSLNIEPITVNLQDN